MTGNSGSFRIELSTDVSKANKMLGTFGRLSESRGAASLTILQSEDHILIDLTDCSHEMGSNQSYFSLTYDEFFAIVNGMIEIKERLEGQNGDIQSQEG